MSDSTFLEIRRLVALSPTNYRWLVTFYESDKNPTRSRRRASFVGMTEADCLRQLAGALEKYGSWDAVAQAVKEAS